MKSSASRPALDAAHPDQRQLRRVRATCAVSASATARTAGPERPPCRRPATARRVRGSIAVARSVLISDSASAPASSAASRDRPDVGDVRRQLHDQRLRGQRAHAGHQGCHLARLGAHHAARLHVRAGDVQLERRDLGRGPATASTSVANSSCEKPATLTIRGTGRVASSGRSCSRNPARPLLGRPIELISPAGVSHRRGGGLPPRGASVIVLETKAANGKLLAERVARRCAAPRSRRRCRSRSGPDARARSPRGRSRGPCRSGRCALSLPALLAGPRPRPPGRPRTAAGSRVRVRTTQPKQAPKPHAMPASSASCAGHRACGADPPHRLEHRRRPARVDHVASRASSRFEQVGDEAVMAARPVPSSVATSTSARRTGCAASA